MRAQRASRILLVLLFIKMTAESALGQCELEELRLDLSVANPSSIDLMADRFIFGSPLDNGFSPGTGSAWICRRANGGWVLEAQLIPPDIEFGDLLGASVVLGDDFALVSAPGDDDADENTGAVHIFTRSGESWTWEQKFTAPIPIRRGRFGETMKLDGPRMIVGEYLANRVHYYHWDGSVWAYQQEINGADLGARRLGYQMDMDESTLVLSDSLDYGFVHVFKLRSGIWELQQTLSTPDDADCSVSCGFGETVAVDGDTIGVAQTTISNDVHLVFLFEEKAGLWVYNQTLLKRSEGQPTFAAITIEEEYLVVGDEGSPEESVDIFYKPGRSDPSSSSSVSTDWLHVAEIPAPDDDDRDFGNSLAMDSSYLVIGGEFSVFSWTLGESVCCRPHFDDIGDGTAGSWGFVPSLDGDGTDCIEGSSRIFVEDCLGQSVGFLVLSTQRGGVPFLDGCLYVEAPWYTTPLSFDGQPGWPGSGSTELMLPALREWVGTTLFAQAFVLDSGAHGGVALSNGLRFRVGAN